MAAVTEPDLIVELPGRDYESSRDQFTWALPERFNLAAACIERHPPDAVALIADHDNGPPREFTFGDLDRTASRLGNALAGLGVKPGDRVGLMVPQGLEVAATHFACYKAGFITMPMSVLFGPDAVTFRLEHADARALVIYEDGLERFAELLYDLPGLNAVVVVSGTNKADTRNRPSGPKFVDFEDAIADASDRLPSIDSAADDPALLLYTSGTTGNPKGVLHAHRWVLGNMPGFRFSHNFYPRGDDRFWTPADWAWGGGIIDAFLPTLFCGRPIVASKRKFDPEWAYVLLARHQVRGSFLPPTALKRMRQEGDPPEGVRMRSIACGGEALGESLLNWTRERLGVVINEFYGQTEANLWVGNCSERWPVVPGSMGRVYPGFDVQIHDEDGNQVGENEQGEIVLKMPSPTAFLEYWRESEKTADKLRGGWLRSGDLGRMDGDGYLWFEGRTDDLIGSAGYRIGPTEIEECLLGHPAVAISAVIGVPDELRGQAVMAFIVPKPGAEAGDTLATELQDHVKHRLAFYQYPREIRFVQELPMTTTGKIMRRVLRQRMLEEQQ